jgi:predicted adenylyl cyclase CyaB
VPANIEIKARARHFSRQKALAEKLADRPGRLSEQEDTFFVVPRGRLKLRISSEKQAELIYYKRSDTTGPKTSRYCIVPTSAPDLLKEVLGAALGVLGTVRKRRWVYHHRRTRIHLDEVEGLGPFLELEVVLGSSAEGNFRETEGVEIAAELMEALEIRSEDLVAGAYLDLLQKR